MYRQDQGNIVFRVQYDAAKSESQLVAYDLTNKAWYQSPWRAWAAQRGLLLDFGVDEVSLLLTDEAFVAGTRDAQFAAIPIGVQRLTEAGFVPKIW